jgi:hypothetical protein
MIGRTAKTVLRESRKKLRPPREVCPLCFEGDHIAGRNHLPHLKVRICKLHHAWLTEQRLAAGAEMHKQADTRKTVEMALRSLAVTGRANASAMNQLCDGLEFCADKMKALNEHGRQT